MESYVDGDVRLILGDGYEMLTKTVPFKSADIAIIDNPFVCPPDKKLLMYQGAAHALKDDGLLVAFDDEQGWEQTIPGIDPYWHIIGRFWLRKNRPMKKPGGGLKTNYNRMFWMTKGNIQSIATKDWTLGFIQGRPMTRANRIKEDWDYNSSDKLGQAAGCKTPNRGSKAIGLAGFVLTHMAACLNRKESDIVVVDPYGGSGTFAIASKLLGFKCFTSEIDAQMYDSAKTKYAYAIKRAGQEKKWFSDKIKQFRDRITG